MRSFIIHCLLFAQNYEGDRIPEDEMGEHTWKRWIKEGKLENVKRRDGFGGNRSTRDIKINTSHTEIRRVDTH
jgi:hypothetical protein